MIGTFQKFWADETGPELVEWAVVTIILLVAAVVLYVAVGKALGGVICAVWCWLEKVRSGESAQGIDRTACDDSENNCDEGG